jgi:hypothetical protein
MEIIVFETTAYWKHIEEVVNRVKKSLMEDKKWINEAEAMEILGVRSKSEMWKLRSNGKIRYSQPSRKIIKYDKQNILKYLENHAKNEF